MEAEDYNNIEENEDKPSFDPECPSATDNDEMECEFENRGGSWWCTTHNCYA